jgi:hypothetical protein
MSLIDGTKLGPWSSMHQARKLVTPRNVFGDEVCTILESGSSNREK